MNVAPFLAEGPPSQGGSPQQQQVLLPSETESGANTSARERSSSVDQKRPDPARGSQPVAGKRRRGRPPGSGDKKPRVRRTKAELARDLALFADVVGGCDFEPGEALTWASQPRPRGRGCGSPGECHGDFDPRRRKTRNPFFAAPTTRKPWGGTLV